MLVDRIRNTIACGKNSKFLIFLVILLPIWVIYITPFLLKIPSNFSYKADVISVDNYYNEELKKFEGEKYSKTDFSYKTLGKKDGVLSIQNTFKVLGADGKIIFLSQPIYGIDAKTGQHVKGYGDKDREGYLFGPRGIKKGNGFVYFHVSSPTPIPMKFVREEQLYGLTVYKYEKQNKDVLDQTEFFGFLPGVPKKRGLKLQSDLYLWIEPVSGYLVKLEDFSADYYFYDKKTGERLTPYNQFLNTYSDQSIRDHVQSAEYYKRFVLVISYGMPLLLMLIILLIVLFKAGHLVKISTFFDQNTIAIIIFLTSISLSLVAYYYTNEGIKNDRDRQFFDQSRDVERLILERISSYENVLRGVRGLFSASEVVSRKEFSEYINSLDIQNTFPGIRGIAFSKLITKEKIPEFEKSFADEGLGNVKVNPISVDNELIPVLFVEPMSEQNKKALGYNAYSDKMRKESYERALETGNFSVTGKLELVQDVGTNKNSSFIMMLPVYSVTNTTTTTTFGFISAGFRMDELMKGIFEDKKIDLDFHIYDGLRTLPEAMYYDYEHGNLSWLSDSGMVGGKTIFHRTVNVYVEGRPWTIEFLNLSTSTPTIFEKFVPLLVLILSLLFSFLIFFTIYSASTTKRKALVFAKELTSELEKSKEILEEKNKEMVEKIEESDALNKIMIERELAMSELKKKIK